MEVWQHWGCADGRVGVWRCGSTVDVLMGGWGDVLMGGWGSGVWQHWGCPDGRVGGVAALGMC